MKDKFGRSWNLPKPQLCPDCGQPHGEQECTHQKLSTTDMNTVDEVICRYWLLVGTDVQLCERGDCFVHCSGIRGMCDFQPGDRPETKH